MMEIKVVIKIWRWVVSNELGRLMNGVNGSKGTNTMQPIHKHKMSNNNKACFQDGLQISDYKKKTYTVSE